MPLKHGAVRAALAEDAERIAQIGSWAWDIGTGELTWSAQLYRIFGLDPDGPSPTLDTFTEAVHPEDVERVTAGAEAARDLDDVPPIQYRIVRKSDGAVRTVIARSIRVHGDGGGRERLVGTVQDVTERINRERELTARTQLLEAAQELANVGTWQWHPSTDTHVWSVEMRRIAGRSGDFHPDRTSIAAQVHPDDVEEFQKRTAALAGDLPIAPHPLRLVRPDGEVRHVVTSVRKVDDPEPWFLGVVHDVTELRRLERGMQQRQTMEAVGELASGVAHDFNNLLTVILGNAQLLDRPEDAAVVADIRAAAEAGAELAHRLLSVGRPAQVRLSPVHLRSQVETAASMLQRVLGPGVSLRSSFGPTPSVLSDPRQIVQILLNLVLNAEQANPASGVIELSTGTDEHGWATVTVSDDGEGMDSETQRRAIEPFFTTRAPGGGSGLGLSMVYGVVTSAGGELAIESTPGRGTTVTLRFPPCDVPLPDPLDSLEMTTPPAATVLVVEDEPGVLRLVRRVLSGAGLRVLAASGPVEAEAVSEPVDLVLSDVAMPDGGGKAVLATFRERQPDVPFVFMTGYAERDPWLEAHTVLAKPFKPKALVAVVKETLLR